MSKLKAKKPEIIPLSKAKMVIYGASGVGKTWGALDFPAVYYIDAEGGAREARYRKKLIDAKGVYFGIEDGAGDFKEVIEQVKALGTEKHEYKTLVIDSLSKLFNSEITREQERLGDKDAFGASKKPAVSLTRRLINWLDRIDMNVILICHEKPMWQNDKQVGVTFDAFDKLEYELDLSLNIKMVGDERKAYVKKSRLEAFPNNSNFVWSYEEFAKKYGKDVIERDTKEIILATDKQHEELKSLLEVVKTSEGWEEKIFTKFKIEAWSEISEADMAKILDTLRKQLTTKGV